MLEYIVISYVIMFFREMYVTRGVSKFNWIFVAEAPITFPLTIVVSFMVAYKEIKDEWSPRDPLEKVTDSSKY